MDKAIRPGPVTAGPGTAGRMLTAAQLVCAMNEIASNAASIAKLVEMLEDRLNDMREAPALCCAIGSLVQRIGWISDLAAEGVSGPAVTVLGDAVQWLMPDHFHCGDGGADPEVPDHV